jgi:hypothetical protein
MHKNAMKCNKTLNKWCKKKHGASKIIDTFETYQLPFKKPSKYFSFCDTVFSSWGRSGRICYLPYCFIPKIKKGKKEKKNALLHGM